MQQVDRRQRDAGQQQRAERAPAQRPREAEQRQHAGRPQRDLLQRLERRLERVVAVVPAQPDAERLDELERGGEVAEIARGREPGRDPRRRRDVATLTSIWVENVDSTGSASSTAVAAAASSQASSRPLRSRTQPDPETTSTARPGTKMYGSAAGPSAPPPPPRRCASTSRTRRPSLRDHGGDERDDHASRAMKASSLIDPCSAKPSTSADCAATNATTPSASGGAAAARRAPRARGQQRAPRSSAAAGRARRGR